MIDATGATGEIFHYTFILFFFGTALLSFLYFWRKGSLDMDETPKMEMMQEDR